MNMKSVSIKIKINNKKLFILTNNFYYMIILLFLKNSKKFICYKLNKTIVVHHFYS